MAGNERGPGTIATNSGRVDRAKAVAFDNRMFAGPIGQKTYPPRGVGTQQGVDEYCRAIETYLCQKNDGHLIRVVGPSFEIVAGWATTGVP